LGGWSSSTAIAKDPSQWPDDLAIKTEWVEVELVETELIEETATNGNGSSVGFVHHLTPCDPLESLPKLTPRGSCNSYLDPFRIRIQETVEPDWATKQHPASDDSIESEIVSSPVMRMWWDDLIDQPLGFSNRQLAIDVGSLTTSALEHSPRIRALLAEPQIRQTSVTIADSEFDPTVFLEGRFIDTNDPVGNELTTGNDALRFRDETFSSNAGLRRRTRNGGEVEIVQRGGFQRNNSIFLQPNPQGTTRLELNYTQPLWKDGGRSVNRSRIVVAQLQANQAGSESRLELEDHLLEVTRAYWDLYRYRALWLLRQKLVGSTRQLHDLLDSRSGFDAGRRHVLRARAALANRQSGLARAAAQIRDAQSRLRALVGSQELIAAANAEWTTNESPLSAHIPVSAKQSVIEALEYRSDITAAIQEIHEVSVRVGAANNQVLPQLDLLLGTYVAGLDAGQDPLGAFENQFSDGRPSFSVGLAYEIPVGNRAAKSRLNRNRWELYQVIQQFKQTTETAISEVEIAARETETAFKELIEKKIAVDAEESEVAYLTQRYQELPGRDDSLILLIDNLLDSQDRLAENESEFVAAQVAYAMSWVKLRKTTGVLLRFEEMNRADSSPNKSHTSAPLSMRRGAIR
jgi:outer membrane protein TolC